MSAAFSLKRRRHRSGARLLEGPRSRAPTLPLSQVEGKDQCHQTRRPRAGHGPRAGSALSGRPRLVLLIPAVQSGPLDFYCPLSIHRHGGLCVELSLLLDLLLDGDLSLLLDDDLGCGLQALLAGQGLLAGLRRVLGGASRGSGRTWS